MLPLGGGHFIIEPKKQERIIMIQPLSPLGHTWILDLDGTIVKHNGYKIDGYDTFLPGAKEFLDGIPDMDFIVFLTSRKEDSQQLTLNFLEQEKIRYDRIVFGAPYGERILINDRKPSGLPMAFAINTDRDKMCNTEFVIDQSL